MRILLLGSTDLTLAVAKTIQDMDVSLAGIVSVPEKFIISYSPNGVTNTRKVELEDWCNENNIPFSTYICDDDILDFREKTNADFILLSGWYHKVTTKVRARFSFGCAGLHASLLPKYRGGAPLNWILLNKEQEAGMSLIKLDDGMDSGDLYGQKSFSVNKDIYIQDVITLAEEAALDLIRECLPRIASSTLQPIMQNGEASYGLQRQPEDGRINWRQDAESIARLIRAVSHPYPGAFTYLDGERIILWKARVKIEAPMIFGSPGQFVRFDETGELLVLTGEGLLSIEEATFVDGNDALGMMKRVSQRHFDNK